MLPAPAPCAAPLAAAPTVLADGDGRLPSGLIWGADRVLPVIDAPRLDPPRAGAGAPEGAPAPAPPRRPRLLIGPQLGLYAPFHRRVQDAFGRNWFNIGFGLGPVVAPRRSGQVEFDLNFLSSRTRRSDAFLAPMGVAYRRALSAGSKTTFYGGVSANALLTVLRSEPDNLASGIRTGFGAGLIAGVAVGNRACIEARAYQFSKVRGFDFSGVNLAVGLRF